MIFFLFCPLRLFSTYRKNQLASSLWVFSPNHNARKFILMRCKHALVENLQVGFAINEKEPLQTSKFCMTSIFMRNLLCHVYVCMDKNFWKQVLLTDAQYTAGKRSIGINLMWQVFFVDRTDWRFTLPIFSMTGLLVEKLPFEQLVYLSWKKWAKWRVQTNK